MRAIGLDVDGVLADFNESFIDRVIAVTGRDLFPPRPFDIPTWAYPEYYGYTAQENEKVWTSIEQDDSFWYDLNAYPDGEVVSKYLADRLLRHDDDLYFITSRPGLRAKSQTEQWLIDELNVFGTVLISSAKGLCAKALKLDVYIDDRWENAVDVASNTNTKAVLMNRPWNTAYDERQFGIVRTNTVVGFAELVNTPVEASRPSA